jgi:hypothetical protein
MRIYKQRPDKRKISFFIFTGLVLLLMLSFFSMDNVYAQEVETSDIDSDYRPTSLASNSISNNQTSNNNYSPDINPGNQWPRPSPGTSPGSNQNGNIGNPNGNVGSPINIITPDTTVDFNPPVVAPVHNDPSTKDEKNSDVVNQNNGDAEEKSDGKSTGDNIIDSNGGFGSIISYYDPNSEANNSDINEYLNQEFILIISSLNFKGNGLENFNNFIKKVAKINFNKFDNDEDISIILYYQSSSSTNLTILFFIKIFMDFHNNGKEHLNSF